MKLLFVITGIGLGHTIREASIIHEIKKQYPETEIIVAGFKNSYAYFKNRFPTIDLKGHKFPEGKFAINPLKALLVNLSYPLRQWQDVKKLKEAINVYNPDKVIVDIQPAGIIAAKKAGKESIAIYNLDLEEWKKYEEEAKISLVNKIQSKLMYHFIKSTYDQATTVIIPSVKKQQKKENRHLIHPIIRKLPQDLPSEKIIMKKLGLKKQPILVMLGGSKFGHAIAEKITNLAKNFNEEFIIFGYKYTRQKNVTSFKFKENFLEYLKVAKAIIILSGHNTPAEAFVYKKPSLIFPFKNYIEHYINVYKMDSYALIKHIDDTITEEQLTTYIQELLEKSPELEKNLKKLNIKKNGTQEAVKLILR